MQCAIYKGNKKTDHYLYVENEDDFSRVPPALLDMLGHLELVISLELSAKRQLAQADVNNVMRQLAEQGYYFQMPPKTGEDLLNQGSIN
ncbi:MAG TPA: YcgL domain-containing protein [Gammaproteobacteria bacterium]|nr:YcgL domain-containing protein [Gammaproteobacteria bacterium]